MVRVGILTVSDLGSRGEREDTAGRALREKVEGMGWAVAHYRIVPDEKAVISATLRQWADDAGLEVILTTGGTGFADRDVTPEATLEVLEKQAPGIPEAMRAAGVKKTPTAILSRGVAGIRGRTLILNLPGSLRGAVESLEAVLEALPHAVDVILGRPVHGWMSLRLSTIPALMDPRGSVTSEPITGCKEAMRTAGRKAAFSGGQGPFPRRARCGMDLVRRPLKAGHSRAPTGR